MWNKPCRIGTGTAFVAGAAERVFGAGRTAVGLTADCGLWAALFVRDDATFGFAPAASFTATARCAIYAKAVTAWATADRLTRSS